MSVNQQGGQDPLGPRPAPDTGHELLDLVEEGAGVAHPVERVCAGQLDVLGTGNLLPEIPTVSDLEEGCRHLLAVEDQGGYPDLREQRADVVTEHLRPVRLRHAGRGTEVTRPVEPRPKGRVARSARRHHREDVHALFDRIRCDHQPQQGSTAVPGERHRGSPGPSSRRAEPFTMTRCDTRSGWVAASVMPSAADR
jgi:hypothetical protein